MPNEIAKGYLSWRNEVDFDFPGYNNGKIMFTKIDNPSDTHTINFLASPTEFSVSKSNMNSEIGSIGGVVIQQFGSTPEDLSISGYLLDAKQLQEAPEFIFNFKRAMTSTQSHSHEYTYSYKQYIEIEGIRYEGRISSFQYSKSSRNPVLYNFRLGFIALSSKIIFNYSVQNGKIQGIITGNTDTPTNDTGDFKGKRDIIDKKGFVF